MCLLNYSIGKNGQHKVTLIDANILTMDSITSKFQDADEIVKNIRYDDIIGTYLYDNEGDIPDYDLLYHKLILEYKPSLEDLAILSSQIDEFKYSETITMDIIYSNNKTKIDSNKLKENILTCNTALEGYLQELENLNKYYLYLRIIDTYYNHKELNKDSSKKLILK